MKYKIIEYVIENKINCLISIIYIKINKMLLNEVERANNFLKEKLILT